LLLLASPCELRFELRNTGNEFSLVRTVGDPQLSHPLLRLLQPVRHPHLPVHRRRGGEVLLRLLPLVRTPAELAAANVAVGDGRAHPSRLGQRQRFAVVGLGLLELPTIRMRGDLSEKPQGPRFKPAFLPLARQLQSALGKPYCIFKSTGEQVTLA